MVRERGCRHPREAASTARLTEEMMQGLRTARIRVTHRCNTDCAYCFIPFEGELPAGQEPREEVVRAVREGAGIVVLTGGEPTLYEDLPGLVRLARQQGAPVVGLQTNGLRLDDASYLQRLVEAGLSYVEVSIPSHREDVYGTIVRSRKAFNRVVKAMENLVLVDLPVNVNHVVCPLNHRDVRGFVAFLMERFRLDVLTILVAAPFSREQAREDVIVRYRDAVPHIREALDLCIDSGMRFEGPWEKCGMPLCVIGDDRYFPGASPIPDGERTPDFIEVPSCKGCRVRDRCYRVRKLYADVYGTDEFTGL